MQQFVHHQVITLQKYFEEFNELQRLFLARSFDFDTKYSLFVSELQEYYSNTDQAKASELLKIQTLLSSIKKGFNPIKLEKIHSGRRELFWGFVHGTTESIHQMLAESLGKERAKLLEAEDILDNIVINLFQNHILTNKKINELDTIPEIEFFWKNLIENNQSISVIDKKLRLQILAEDIYVLIEKILRKIQ